MKIEPAIPFRFTRRQLVSVLCFTLVFGLLFWAAERLFYDDSVYCTTWNAIKTDGEVPEILIMGNSHAYCSFVPDIINGALGVDSAVLAVTGQDAMGITDNFETVLKTGKPRLVIAELNAFYFAPGLMAKDNKGAALNNINGMPGLFQRVRIAEREFGIENVPQGAFQLLRADLMRTRWANLFEPAPTNRYEHPDILGYGRLDYFCTGDYRSDGVTVTGDPSAVEGSEALHPAAQTELRRFLTLAKDNGVEVWLIKAPIASRGVVHPNGVDMSRHIAAEFGETVSFCYDYNEDLPALNFTTADFYDGGHLNRRGAARFTQWFVKTTGERLGLVPDLDEPFAYLDETITPLQDGQYRYTIIASGKELLYRYELLDADGQKTLLQDWSKEASVVCAVESELADLVQVTVCPSERFDEQEVYGMTLRFMTANTCILNR